MKPWWVAAGAFLAVLLASLLAALRGRRPTWDDLAEARDAATHARLDAIDAKAQAEKEKVKHDTAAALDEYTGRGVGTGGHVPGGQGLGGAKPPTEGG